MAAYGSAAIALSSGAMSLRHPLVGFLGRRILLGALALLLVSIVVFAATQILPGDAARALLGRSATPERLQALRLQLHLDRPALTQYWIWLSGIFSGDLGTSLVTPRSVYELAVPRIANSFSLLLIVGAIGVPVAVAFGIAAAV